VEHPVPDRSIVAALQRIDPDLSVDFVQPPGRWAVFHALQINGNFEASVDRVAAALRQEALTRGYVFDQPECALAACEALRWEQLVCYVVNDDGSYRALDGRIVKKLARMDWYRQNLGIGDWRNMLRAKAEVARERAGRDRSDVWDVIERDSTFKKQLSDILWGHAPGRSTVYLGEHGPATSASQPRTCLSADVPS